MLPPSHAPILTNGCEGNRPSNSFLINKITPYSLGELVAFMSTKYLCKACFGIFLDELSKQRPTEYKIVTLDNGAFHKAKSLQIPENIVLIFLPSYSLELNPEENMWARLKRTFTNRLFKTLDELSEFICTVISVPLNFNN
jgi:hypothetical protein